MRDPGPLLIAVFDPYKDLNMLALLYLCVMFALGDAIGRRFFTFVSFAHRGASAFLIGALLSSWWTYALAYLCSSATSPMLWGNLLFFITAGGLILWLNQNPQKDPPSTALDVSDAQFNKWDWIITGVFLLFIAWMMFQTLAMSDGTLLIGHHQNADFGSTLSIMQSFAVGHNFPTEYPHFTGERIRYHFLFYFLAGDLQYLGLSPVIANNLLSIFSLTAMLILVMTLAGVLFKSRVAGRIGAALFFTHGSLAYVAFLSSQPSFSAFIDALNSMTKFLPGLRDPAGVPYRGEDWGVWTLNVYLNQRHLSSAIAIFLLILIYVVIRLREQNELEPEPVAELSTEDIDFADAEGSENEQLPLAEHRVDSIATDDEEDDEEIDDDQDSDEDDEDDYEDEDEEEDDDDDDEIEEEDDFSLSEYIKENSVVVFCGVLLGLLPMWNGAIFLGAGVVLAAMIVLFSRFRRQLITLAVTAAIVSLPQIIYLKTGHVKEADYSMLHWGFVIQDAGIFNVLWWTFHTFGFKLVLLGIALYFSSGLGRRLLLAASVLLPLTYCFKFSEEILANHKFINLWLVIVNIYCGYAIVKLWYLKTGKSVLPSRIAAILMLILVVIGGLIDLMPIKNSDDPSFYIKYKYYDNKLLDWVRDNTDPKSIFLTDKFINHEILLAGRRLFYGDPYYAWGTDYDTREREKIVKTMLESKDANQVFSLLKQNNISYIAMDDRLRRGNSIVKNVTEEVFANYFEVVFSDDSTDFGGHMKIYKVPDSLPNVPSASPTDNPDDQSAQPAPEANIFQGASEGTQPGQFNKPRGLAVDAKGFIYVADYFNSRVQKFAPDGKFVLTFGTKGEGSGQFKEPNSIVVDDTGAYVTDGLAHKMLKFDADGKFVKEWTKPAVDFYGARDLAWGPNKKLYIIDQGHTQITVFDPAADTFTSWGSGGPGDGQFNEATGIGIGGNMIFIADRDNKRVQVFDLDGKFIRQWPIIGWERSHFPDVVYDDVAKRVYVSHGGLNQILVFDVDGNPLPPLTTEQGEMLNNPSAMVIVESGKQRRLFVLNTGGQKVSTIGLEAKKAEAKKGK